MPNYTTPVPPDFTWRAALNYGVSGDPQQAGYFPPLYESSYGGYVSPAVGPAQIPAWLPDFAVPSGGGRRPYYWDGPYGMPLPEPLPLPQELTDERNVMMQQVSRPTLESTLLQRVIQAMLYPSMY